jgi:type IV pilus assembly protein PilO
MGNNIKRFIEKLNSLNPRDIHNWPLSIITFFGVLIVLLISIMGYFLIISSEVDDLTAVIQKEEKLKKEYIEKIQQAINLNAYKKQLIDITIASDQLLKQLPDKSEVNKILIYLNQSSLNRGLKFNSVIPDQEKSSDFYAELPIKIKVSGTYAGIGGFAFDVSQLSRVIVLKDINLSVNTAGVVSMEAIAKTFRYLDENELEKKKADKQKLKQAKAEKEGK